MYLQVMLKHVEPLSEGQILGIYQLQQSVQESVVWIPSDSENPDKKNHNSFIGFEYFKYLWVKIPLKSRLFEVVYIAALEILARQLGEQGSATIL